eukprot:4257119-Alexandrium_andersonii.AAC.1
MLDSGTPAHARATRGAAQQVLLQGQLRNHAALAATPGLVGQVVKWPATYTWPEQGLPREPGPRCL